MPIKRLTPQNQVDAELEEQIKRMEEAIINTMEYVGEECIKDARELGSYTDRTSNLRSSIGYIVVKEGKTMKKGGFETVKEGNDGANKGSEFIEKLVSEYAEGIVLIVVAGMEYAAAVTEKMYNVIDTAEILAKRMVPELLEQIGIKKK